VSRSEVVILAILSAFAGWGIVYLLTEPEPHAVVDLF